MKKRANISSQDKNYLETIDKEMALSKKIVALLDERALTIEEIKEELEKTIGAIKVDPKEIETAIFLAFSIKTIPGVDNSRVYFLESQDRVALKRIKEEQFRRTSDKVVQEEKISVNKTESSNQEISSDKDSAKTKVCFLCGSDCSKLFNIAYKEKTICGACIKALQDVIHLHQVGNVVSLREIRLKEQIEDLKTKLQEKNENASKEPKVIKPNKTVVFYLKILPVLLNTRSIFKTNIPDTAELVETVKTFIPIVYKEIFEEDFPTSLVLVEKITVGFSAELAVCHKRRIDKPKKIFTFEPPLPNEPLLREKAEQSLRQKLRRFSSAIWAKDIAVIMFDRDDRVVHICEEEMVNYFWVKPLFLKIAEMFDCFDKLDDAWAGRENFNV